MRSRAFPRAEILGNVGCMTSVPLSFPSVAPCPIELFVRARDPVALDAGLRSGGLKRVMTGVYAQADAWEELPVWDRYLARVHAVRARRPETVFLLESAAALLGLPVLGSPRHVHVLARTTSASRITGAVQGHYAAHPVAVETSEAFSRTSLLDTVVDIARARHPVYALAVLDHAARHAGLTPAEAGHANDFRPSPRGRAAAAWAIGRMSPVPESVLESVSLALIEWLGFPRPELQVEFDLGRLGIARVDTFWPDAGVIGEADGAAKYLMPEHGPGAAVLAEKRREDALRRIAHGFVRWGWEECRHPERLERLLVAAGVRRIRRPDHTRLRTAEAFLSS